MSGFLDTNVLLHAFGDDDRRGDVARSLVHRGGVAISVQILNEFTAVALRKLRHSWAEIDEALALVLRFCVPVVPLTLDTHRNATTLCRRYRLHIDDALIAAAALEAGCDTLYSEDMHTGLVIGSQLTIINPFA